MKILGSPGVSHGGSDRRMMGFHGTGQIQLGASLLGIQ